MANNGAPDSARIDQAVSAMLSEYSSNPWMLNEHWPLIGHHIRLAARDVMMRIPPAPGVSVLDVACGNGYVSVIFRQLGYDVTATDASEVGDRPRLFDKSGIDFVHSNLNDLDFFENLPNDHFEVVVILQLIEHILNHPLGLIRKIANIMRPGGLMVLTTPNPATVMNAVRILKGTPSLWGTSEFIDEPKIDRQKEIITRGDIHYREYTSQEINYMLTKAGLRVERSCYLGLGASRSQSRLKKALKGNALVGKLMSTRLLGSNHYFLARKPA